MFINPEQRCKMIIRFPESKITPEVYDSIETHYLESVVYYIINSKYRKAVKLSRWIKEQVDNPKEEVIAWANAIDTHSNPDSQMISILRYVNTNLTYISDKSTWSMLEYWQEGDITASLGTGDCEDGAILMYLIARIKGVPENRLLLLCGSVNGGGHCWLAYKPNGLPVDYVFLDWCYFVNTSDINSRNKFSVIDNSIYEYDNNNELTPLSSSNYLNIWNAFNENHSYTRLTYNYGNTDG